MNDVLVPVLVLVLLSLWFSLMSMSVCMCVYLSICSEMNGSAEINGRVEKIESREPISIAGRVGK
jgi:hypothetical protein